FAFEGDGRVREYVGGYADWIRQTLSSTASAPAASASVRSSTPVAAAKARRPSYKEQRELESLPARIEALEEEQRTLEATIAAPEFYKEPAATITATLARFDALQQE